MQSCARVFLDDLGQIKALLILLFLLLYAFLDVVDFLLLVVRHVLGCLVFRWLQPLFDLRLHDLHQVHEWIYIGRLECFSLLLFCDLLLIEATDNGLATQKAFGQIRCVMEARNLFEQFLFLDHLCLLKLKQCPLPGLTEDSEAQSNQEDLYHDQNRVE